MTIRGKQDRSFQRALRIGQTDAEAKLWLDLRDRRFLGHKFRRQHQIGSYTVDFVCPDRALVIELDGGQHAEQEAYDATRTAFLESQGYRVIRFWNHEVLTHPEAVLEAIVRARQATHPSP